MFLKKKVSLEKRMSLEKSVNNNHIFKTDFKTHKIELELVPSSVGDSDTYSGNTGTGVGND